MKNLFSLAVLVSLLPAVVMAEVSDEVKNQVLEKLRQRCCLQDPTCCGAEAAGQEEVHSTPIHELYLIEERDGYIFYFFPETGHLFSGEIHAPDGTDLAEPVRERRLLLNWEDIVAGRELAVKVGSGPIEVFEIIDPSSPECRRMQTFWQTRSDVTRYVFLLSPAAPEAEGAWMIRYILGAVDRAEALREIMAGKVVERPEEEGLSEAGYAAFRMQDFLVRLGIKEVPHYFIRSRMVRGADPVRIREILEGGATDIPDASASGPHLETIYFPYDSHQIDAASQAALERNFHAMERNPEVGYLLIGHTDERGTNEHNLAIGERQAIYVKKWMVSRGIDPGRLTIISHGEERPADPGHDEAAWAGNRRVEVKVKSSE
jgi:peptidoglycan-associated lipoprotein